MFESLERLIVTVLVLGIFGVLAAFSPAVLSWRVRRRTRLSPLSDVITLGLPTLLYFWTPECAQCRPQERHIDQVRKELERNGRTLAVRKVNALEERGLAGSLQVMTVPTTVLVDSRGQVTAWNAGLTEARKILSQFAALV